MIRNIRYNEFMQETLAQLPRGALLSVKAGEIVNTMTIGWGFAGFMWRTPMLIVAVRPSRYTFELMEKADNFTVSFPAHGELKKALADAGRASGRDTDKFTSFNLTPQPGTMIESPSIAECNLVYECQLLYKHPLEPELLPTEKKYIIYQEAEYIKHLFAKILTSYINE